MSKRNEIKIKLNFPKVSKDYLHRLAIWYIAHYVSLYTTQNIRLNIAGVANWFSVKLARLCRLRMKFN